jgi:hypothetical protein
MNSKASKVRPILFGWLTILALGVGSAGATDYTWVGGGTWNETTNWNPGAIPGATDRALFFTNSTMDCSLDADRTVDTIDYIAKSIAGYGEVHYQNQTIALNGQKLVVTNILGVYTNVQFANHYEAFVGTDTIDGNGGSLQIGTDPTNRADHVLIGRCADIGTLGNPYCYATLNITNGTFTAYARQFTVGQLNLSANNTVIGALNLSTSSLIIADNLYLGNGLTSTGTIRAAPGGAVQIGSPEYPANLTLGNCSSYYYAGGSIEPTNWTLNAYLNNLAVANGGGQYWYGLGRGVCQENDMTH